MDFTTPVPRVNGTHPAAFPELPPLPSNRVQVDVDHLAQLAEAADDDELAGGPLFSEDGIATAYLERFGVDRRYNIDQDEWLFWTGDSWSTTAGKVSATAMVRRQLCRMGRLRFHRRNSKGEPKRDEATGGRWSTAGAAQAAAASSGITATRANDWDTRHAVIGLPGGKLVEQIGRRMVTRDRTRDDLVLRELAALPEADDDAYAGGAWMQHVCGLFEAEPDNNPAAPPSWPVAELLQRLVGYAVLGTGEEDKVVLASGPGGTGKTATCNLIRRAFGGYGATVNASAIIRRDGAAPHAQNRMGAALLRWRPNQSLRRRRGRRQLDPSRRGEERRRVRWPTVLLSSATDGGLPLVLARFVRGLSTHQGSGCPRRLRTAATAAKCHRAPVDSHRVADQMPTGPSMSRRRAPHAASPLPRG